MASTGVVNVSSVVGNKVTNTVYEKQRLRTTHVVLKEPGTSLATQTVSSLRRVWRW